MAQIFHCTHEGCTKSRVIHSPQHIRKIDPSQYLCKSHAKSLFHKNKNTQAHECSELLRQIKQRCFNKNNDQYPNYGGKGITIFQEWLDNPQAFYKWLDENSFDRKTMRLVRKNKAGNFVPDNLLFVMRK